MLPSWRKIRSIIPSIRCGLKVYTKTGDKGSSSLFTGERRRKDDRVFEALGATDEVNAQIGVALQYSNQNELRTKLEQVQCVLLDLGSTIATPESSANEAQRSRVIPLHLERVYSPPTHTPTLEAWIDELDQELPELRNFILPVAFYQDSIFPLDN